ncbi:MAG: hypothetical protein KDC98_00105 [Planctomycetes bacterium]|nr:hypothetical protein [Planctomycetota bacterium]
MSIPGSALLLAALAAHAAAQTFVVDINNGPGTDFVEIAAAVAAVPDGAVLQVRPGTYGSFQIRAKSLSVVGGPGVYVSGSFFQLTAIEILDIASHQSVSIRDVGLAALLGLPRVGLRDCDGTVVLDAFHVMPDTVAAIGGRLVVSGCQQVIVHESHIAARTLVESTIEAYGSNVVLDDCVLGTTSACIRQGGGRVQVKHCRLERESGVFSTGAALMVLAGGELLLHGDTVLDGANVASVTAGAGTGTIVLDPSTVLQGLASPAFDPNLTLANRSIPRLDASTQARGGAASATLAVPAAGVGFLHVGFATSPVVLPGIVDPIWLAMPAALHAVGGSPAVAGGYSVPNAPWVLGVTVAWQGIVLDRNGGLAASNPAAYIHH